MKNFYARISLSIFSISTLLILSIICLNKSYYLTAISLIIIAILVIWNIFIFNKRIEKDIQLFLQNAKSKDDSLQIATNNYGKPFQLFFQTYKTILESQHTTTEENFQLQQLLSTILDKTTTGFIVIRKSQEVYEDILYINNAAQTLLHIPQINNWQRILHKIPALKTALEKILNGGKSFLSLNNGTELSIESQPILSNNQPLLLLTIQDIQSEMDTKETDSWNKLIQVMTHEILNSLTPINTMSFILENLSKKELLDDEDKEDMLLASSTIQTRTKGLMQFVQDYRKVAALPIPQKNKIKLQPFLENIVHLFRKDVNDLNIQLDIICEEDAIVIWADQMQIEQAIVNLISNAFHAVENQINPTIQIECLHSIDAVQILVKDNGRGIILEDQPQIFVPFFTTRKEGSGIGLSVVRNIMRMHGGSITVQSEGENKGSIFTLHFPYKY
jgi:two-component system, NtrC family, nitrogen regulation sensor histidine kinase NtrY